MGYNTNYDPISETPFGFGGFVHHKPFDHRIRQSRSLTGPKGTWTSWLGMGKQSNTSSVKSLQSSQKQDGSLDSEWYVYTYQEASKNKYVLDLKSVTSNTKLTAVPISLPLSKTKPYEWIEKEPYVLLLPDGTLIKEGVTNIDSGRATVNHATTGSREYSITSWDNLEAIPFYRCVWNLVCPFAKSRGYSSADIFRLMAPTIDTYVSYMNQDCYFTFDPVFRNTSYFVEYLPNVGSKYKHPSRNREEKQRILHKLDDMFPIIKSKPKTKLRKKNNSHASTITFSSSHRKITSRQVLYKHKSSKKKHKA